MILGNVLQKRDLWKGVEREEGLKVLYSGVFYQKLVYAKYTPFENETKNPQNTLKCQSKVFDIF